MLNAPSVANAMPAVTLSPVSPVASPPRIIDVVAVPSVAVAPCSPRRTPVRTILDDLAERFPHAEGEGRFPVPGDWRNEHGEWNDTLFKVVGFSACYSGDEDADSIEMGEPFTETDFVRDTVGMAIIVYKRENAEALRCYADEVIGMPIMTVPNPLGSGFMFLNMDPATHITPAGHALFEKLAAYLNYRDQPWIACMIAATFKQGDQ